MLTRSFALLGASGLVGGHLLALLAADEAYSRGTLIGRRPLGLERDKLREVVVDFDRPEALHAHLTVDEVFCCLGTTIRKAGSQDAFRRVDHDYPLLLARMAKAAGTRQFIMVSALGANSDSPVFYSRVKGETERDIAAIGLPKVIFMRPSILLGERQEHRPGEGAGALIGQLIAPLLVGRLRKYRPIPADDVAAAMIYSADHDVPAGPIDSDEIVRLARRENAGR